MKLKGESQYLRESKPPSPDTSFGDPTEAAGGNVIGHASTYRIYLRKSGENRTAKMIDL